MFNYYYACGGSCNGPVMVSAGNINEARLLAQEECDRDGCCQYLGCDGVGCAGNATLTEAQKSFEGTSRLFEAGFSIEQVALVTGHKDWKMLRRYTHLKPETLHSIRSVRIA
jgi:hypothetical protein